MNWSGCELVQEDPRYVSGAPALRDQPRVMVDPIIENVTHGMAPEKVARLYGVPVSDVLAIYEFYCSHSSELQPTS